MRRKIEDLPLFPLIPIVPAVLFGGTFLLSVLSFVRLRKLSRTVARMAPTAAY